MGAERSQKPVLSVRERQILTLLAEGRTPSQVADDIGISLQAVQTQMLMARAKLGTTTTVHLVAVALALGEIEIWPPPPRPAEEMEQD